MRGRVSGRELEGSLEGKAVGMFRMAKKNVDEETGALL